MLLLRYSPRDDRATDLIDRLRELVLAHKLEETPGLVEPVLCDSGEEIAGAAAIHRHLDGIQGEQHQWWYCSC